MNSLNYWGMTDWRVSGQKNIETRRQRQGDAQTLTQEVKEAEAAGDRQRRRRSVTGRRGGEEVSNGAVRRCPLRKESRAGSRRHGLRSQPAFILRAQRKTPLESPLQRPGDPGQICGRPAQSVTRGHLLWPPHRHKGASRGNRSCFFGGRFADALIPRHFLSTHFSQGHFNR